MFETLSLISCRMADAIRQNPMVANRTRPNDRDTKSIASNNATGGAKSSTQEWLEPTVSTMELD